MANPLMINMLKLKLANAIQRAIPKATKIAMNEFEEEISNNYPSWVDQSAKGSYYRNESSGKFELGYHDKRVAKFDGGEDGQPIVGRFIQNVKSHARQLPSGETIQVRRQRRVYTNKKILKTPQNRYYVAQQTPKTGGSRFFSKAIDKFRTESFPTALKKEIERLMTKR